MYHYHYYLKNFVHFLCSHIENPCDGCLVIMHNLKDTFIYLNSSNMLYLILKIFKQLHSTEQTANLELPAVMGAAHL